MDAAKIIAGWKHRLTEMAANSPYVFRDTPDDLIEQFKQKKTLFIGWSDREISSAEAELGIAFPTVFRQYLLEMGKSNGDLFCGSECAEIDEFEKYQMTALRMLDPDLSLPRHAVVFMTHQGYTFLYFEAKGGFDAPIMQWIERERAPKQVSPGFCELVNAELGLAESNHKYLHEKGGQFVTLSRSGGSTWWSPSSGKRPLDWAKRVGADSRSKSGQHQNDGH